MIAIEMSERALHDCDHFVRWRAALALGNIKEPKAIDPLVLALNDSDGDIREAAKRSIDALGKLKAEEAGDI